MFLWRFLCLLANRVCQEKFLLCRLQITCSDDRGMWLWITNAYGYWTVVSGKQSNPSSLDHLWLMLSCWLCLLMSAQGNFKHSLKMLVQVDGTCGTLEIIFGYIGCMSLLFVYLGTVDFLLIIIKWVQWYWGHTQHDEWEKMIHRSADESRA